MQNYLFGYGSLICTVSRNRHTHEAKAIPVRIKGWQRCWNHRSRSRKRNVLGVYPKEGAVCNGVIFEVKDFTQLNERENGYSLVEIDNSSIEAIGKHEIPQARFWLYVPKEPMLASSEFPIQQSYLDVVMTGCLEYGDEFASELVETTEWSSHWIDDRKEPNYSSYLDNVDSERIDRLLKALNFCVP